MGRNSYLGGSTVVGGPQKPSAKRQRIVKRFKALGVGAARGVLAAERAAYEERFATEGGSPLVDPDVSPKPPRKRGQ